MRTRGGERFCPPRGSASATWPGRAIRTRRRHGTGPLSGVHPRVTTARCCPATGWSSAPSPGWAAIVVIVRTTNATRHRVNRCFVSVPFTSCSNDSSLLTFIRPFGTGLLDRWLFGEPLRRLVRLGLSVCRCASVAYVIPPCRGRIPRLLRLV